MEKYLFCSIHCLIFAALFGSQASGQVHRVDLREWGYKPPENSSETFRTQLSSQIISVGQNGEMVAGFVTRDRTGLATRELPPLSLHVVRFAKNGQFVLQASVPTPSWQENAIFYGASGELLIRTGTRLTLFSSNMERVTQRDLPLTPNSHLINWKIIPLPSRRAFLLYHFRSADTSIALFNWNDSKPLKECSYSQNDNLLSASNMNILSWHPSGRDNPLSREIEVSEICGPSRFSYSWDGEPLSAALADDSSIILAGGGPSVSFVVGGKVLWKDVFNKKSDVVSNHVEVSADGRFIAVAVKKFKGGSQFLDIPRMLKSIRVVVYVAKSGRKALEVPIDPTRSSSSFDFALSPSGDILAILSDGFLEIVATSLTPDDRRTTNAP